MQRSTVATTDYNLFADPNVRRLAYDIDMDDSLGSTLADDLSLNNQNRQDLSLVV